MYYTRSMYIRGTFGKGTALFNLYSIISRCRGKRALDWESVSNVWTNVISFKIFTKEHSQRPVAVQTWFVFPSLHSSRYIILSKTEETTPIFNTDARVVFERNINFHRDSLSSLEWEDDD